MQAFLIFREIENSLLRLAAPIHRYSCFRFNSSLDTMTERQHFRRFGRLRGSGDEVTRCPCASCLCFLAPKSILLSESGCNPITISFLFLEGSILRERFYPLSVSEVCRHFLSLGEWFCVCCPAVLLLSERPVSLPIMSAGRVLECSVQCERFVVLECE